MTDVNEWIWVFDEPLMICRNEKNKVIVKIEKTDETYTGKLQDMPMELFAEIAGFKHGEKIIESIVKSAEKEFFRTYHI